MGTIQKVNEREEEKNKAVEELIMIDPGFECVRTHNDDKRQRKRKQQQQQ